MTTHKHRAIHVNLIGEAGTGKTTLAKAVAAVNPKVFNYSYARPLKDEIGKYLKVDGTQVEKVAEVPYTEDLQNDLTDAMFYLAWQCANHVKPSKRREYIDKVNTAWALTPDYEFMSPRRALHIVSDALRVGGEYPLVLFELAKANANELAPAGTEAILWDDARLTHEVDTDVLNVVLFWYLAPPYPTSPYECLAWDAAYDSDCTLGDYFLEAHTDNSAIKLSIIINLNLHL